MIVNPPPNIRNRAETIIVVTLTKITKICYVTKMYQIFVTDLAYTKLVTNFTVLKKCCFFISFYLPNCQLNGVFVSM